MGGEGTLQMRNMGEMRHPPPVKISPNRGGGGHSGAAKEGEKNPNPEETPPISRKKGGKNPRLG